MVISIQDIEKQYDRQVLHKVSYEFESGKLYVIKGVSGCGKSTLFHIMGGLERDFSGKIFVDGRECEASGESLRNMTGQVFQYSLLLSHVTVLENLLFIRNDRERVEALSREFGITELLLKYPEQISGGERQRVSLVRALLLNPKLLLADEPTASLDEENSRKTAQMIADLKSGDHILLVATHEHYFDELADEILYLKYGEIERVEKVSHNKGERVEEKRKTGKESKTESKEETKEEKNEKTKEEISKERKIQKEKKKARTIPETGEKPNREVSPFRYNLRRNRKMLRFRSLLPFIVMFLLILLSSTAQNSFEKEYMSFIKENYPVDALNLYKSQLEFFPYRDRLEVYDYYTATEDGVSALYLADEKESVLAIEGMIEYGNFPKKPEEVLVSREFLEHRYREKVDYRQYVGEKIQFLNREFTISGILFSMSETVPGSGKNEEFINYFNSDIYYRRMEGSLVFIPYDTIKTILAPQEKVTDRDEVVVRACYRGLFDDEKALEALRSLNPNRKVNVFDSEIAEAKRSLNEIVKILLLVFLVCFVISCLFLSSQIQIELFYRKKELGFLQVFGMEKKRIRGILFSGYLMKAAASLVASVLVYFLLLVIYFIFTKHWVILNLSHTIGVLVCICLFYFATVFYSSQKFLKRDVMKLITE